MTKDTRPEWEIAREEREALRNDAASNLLPPQRTALLFTRSIHSMVTYMTHQLYYNRRLKWKLQLN